MGVDPIPNVRAVYCIFVPKRFRERRVGVTPMTLTLRMARHPAPPST